MAPAVGRVHRALLPEPTPEPVLEYADQKDQFATTNSTLWRQQRYAPRDNHYLWDPCAGIGTVGDVCPQVLPCATPGCAIRKLPGLAYNPSVVRAPAWVVAAAARALPPTAPPVRYVASDRIGRNNIPVRCRNKAATNILFSPKEHRETRQHHKHAHTGAALVGDALLPHPHPNGTHASNRTVDLGSGSDLLLLDAALRVVVRAPIHGGACAQSPDALVDVRLFDAAGALYASYNTYGRAAWTRFIPGARVVPHGKDCKGHWVSRLELNFAKDGAHFSDRRPLHVNATPTERFGGSGLSGTPGEKLAAARNAGLLAASAAAHLVSVTNRSERHEELLADAFAKPNPLSALSTSAAAAAAPGLELVHFAPWTEWRVRGGGVVRGARRPPPSPRICTTRSTLCGSPRWVRTSGSRTATRRTALERRRGRTSATGSRTRPFSLATRTVTSSCCSHRSCASRDTRESTACPRSTAALAAPRARASSSSWPPSAARPPPRRARPYSHWE